MHDPVSSTQAETARADSERQYRELVQNANSAIIRWRRDGTIIFFNEWAQKFFGYSAEEAVGKHISLLVPGRESTGRDLSPMVQDIVEHPGKYENNTNENVCRDGRRVWMAWTNRPITNPDGTVEEILSVGTDITELVRTEQALRESEARLKKVLEAETVGVMFWDLSTGCLVDANDTFLNMMGHSRRDVAERSLTWQKLTAPEYIEQSLAEIRKFQETGRVGPYEKEYLRKDGTRQWFVFAGSSIGKDACVEFCVDISDRKNAEAALRASEGRYRTLFNEATEGIGLADAETGTILECNRAFAALTGYSREELIGMPQSMLHPPRDVRGGVSQTFELHRTSQRGVVIPTEIITKSGETKHVEIKANVVELGGRRASLAFFRDVTEELLHEREREIMVRLLRLLSEQGDTHELVRGLTALLQEWSGCESVGVRLREADDYPYFETRGFGAEFVRLETSLCCRGANGEILRDEDGMPLLECTCGDVLRGRFDPSWPFCTQKGSFWVNSITELATTLPGILHRPHARNRCIDEGYESVALIPLRSGGATHGLLQLNDRSKGRFSPELLAFLENVADQFAMALTQRQAQAALRESEEHYRSLFSNMINGLAYCRILLDDQGRPEDFIYLAVNDAFEALTGLGGVVGKKVSEVIPGILEKDHELIETYARVALTGVPERFERWVEALQMWFHISAYSPQREHFVAIFEVVTERKQAEVALRQSEERYRELVQHANSAILRYRGGDGAITFFNEYAQSFFGYGLEEILGKNVSILLPETDSSGADLSQLVADIVKHPGRYVNNENENICRDGRRVWMAWTNRVLPDAAGRVNEILAVGTDITERKRAQDEQDRLDRQRQLALNAAHLGWWHYDHASGTSTGDQRYREIFGPCFIPMTCRMYCARWKPRWTRLIPNPTPPSIVCAAKTDPSYGWRRTELPPLKAADRCAMPQILSEPWRTSRAARRRKRKCCGSTAP
jgi:PAS domain S-box-containing protein